MAKYRHSNSFFKVNSILYSDICIVFFNYSVSLAHISQTLTVQLEFVREIVKS